MAKHKYTKMDYSKITIPIDKDPHTYSFGQRRAEILTAILQAGHPRLVSQTQLSKRYNVTQGQISQDVSALKEYIIQTADSHTVRMVTEVVYQKAISELMRQGEYSKAVNALTSWTNWKFDTGEIVKAPTEISLSSNAPDLFTQVAEELEKEDNAKHEKPRKKVNLQAKRKKSSKRSV